METATLTSETNPLPSGSLLELISDINEEGQFGTRRLVITAEEVRVQDERGVPTLRVPMSDISHARHEPLVSGGRTIIETKSGARIAAITYSLAFSEAFSDAARGIEQLAKGEPFTILVKEEKIRCEKCNRLLPEKDGLCPVCINRGKTMVRIFAFLKPYKRATVYLVLMSVATTVLNLVPPRLQKELVDGFIGKTLGVNGLLQYMGVWLGAAILTSVLQVFNGRTMTYLATHISKDLRSVTYRAIEFLNMKYFDRKPVGAIASRVTQDTDRIWHFLVDGFPFFITNSLMALGVMTFLFLTNWVIALAILTPIPFVLLISVKYWKPISNLFFKVSQRMARLHMQLNESLSGIRVVKAFTREDHEFARFTNRNNAWQQAAMDADQRWYTAYGMMTFCASLGALINWTLGGIFVVQGKLTLGEFVMINSLLVMVYGPLQWFAQVNNWFSRAMAGAERVFEVMDMTPEFPIEQGAPHMIVGNVEFRNVRFGYDKSNPVLKNISFEAKAGEMIGLVGRSGAGKSSTINLICRFYEPDGGEIRIDGVPINDLAMSDYRQQIGIVLQDPFLFGGTVAENIAYGKPGATMEEIITAARAANAHDFVVGKQDGYDTIVGERGVHLSGGEKQRISIARAILHNPRILILDEATSSVDVETEKQIQEAINRLVEGRTVFAIAHRLSTLRNADRLIVLERGEIAEIGSHEELMEKKGVFYNLVETQRKVTEIIEVGE
ncbi:MAG: ABC transporter ATP-binding protein [Fimbriimonadaceae bacterium]|nr:ABC transporter ATP-binding protein [Fimbriimonadaceae bacterium]